MWCPSCQQDVPAVSLESGKQKGCPRCKRELGAGEPDRETQLDIGLELDAATASEKPPIDLDNWEFTERLKRIERLLARQHTVGPSRSSSDLGRENRTQHRVASYRTDTPHSEPSGQRRMERRPPGRRIGPGRTSQLGLWLVWLLALVGTACWFLGTTALAGVPAASAMVSSGLALPLQAAGVCMLLISVFAAMEHAASTSRRIGKQLDAIDAATTDLRTASPYRNETSGASAFYADVARSASPHVLLADIKGQLDQLTVRMISDAKR